jgi:hypothetical protein
MAYASVFTFLRSAHLFFSNISKVCFDGLRAIVSRSPQCGQRNSLLLSSWPSDKGMNPLHFGQVNPVVWVVSIVFLFFLFRHFEPGRLGNLSIYVLQHD